MQHKHGGDIYGRENVLDFSANLNPLGMPESVRQAAREAVDRSDRYPDPRCRQLRRAVSLAEQIPEEEIVFGCGAAELIFALVQAERPKRALLAVPGFAEYEIALAAVGTACRYYELTEENGFRLGEDFLAYLTDEADQPDMVFLCNPNNPTGLPIDHDLLMRIVRICGERHIRLVVDECFNGLWPDGACRSVKPYLQEVPELFILRAFTKLYAMAGLRLGYGLTADPHLPELLGKVMQPWSISVPAQEAGAAAAALTEYEELTRAYVGTELARMKEGFRDLAVTFWESEANYLFFKGPEDLQERLLERGIMIRDCSNYRGLAPGYFRAAVRTEEENRQLLKALQEVL